MYFLTSARENLLFIWFLPFHMSTDSFIFLVVFHMSLLLLPPIFFSSALIICKFSYRTYWEYFSSNIFSRIKMLFFRTPEATCNSWLKSFTKSWKRLLLTQTPLYNIFFFPLPSVTNQHSKWELIWSLIKNV